MNLGMLLHGLSHLAGFPSWMMPPPGGLVAAAVSWNDALTLYAMAMRAAGRSGGTINLHRHYLRNLAEQLPRGPWTADDAALVAFLAVTHWAPETRKSARAAVRGFYRWAHGSGYLSDDPAHALPAVRVPPGKPRPAPEHLVRSLRRRDDDRVVFMAELAALAGLRAGEIARVHADHLVDDMLRVVGKGGKARLVPILDDQLLARLRAVTGWAFPNGQGRHLSPGHVSRLLSRSMPQGWTAHTLRHRFGTRAYAGTRDLLAVGELMGHSRPETTQRYVLMPDDALRDAVRAAGQAS